MEKPMTDSVIVTEHSSGEMGDWAADAQCRENAELIDP